MDQQVAISKEQTNEFMNMLNLMDPKLVDSFRKFLHEVITQGISHHSFSLNTLNKCFMNYSQECIEDIVNKAICFYEVESSGDVKSWAYT